MIVHIDADHFFANCEIARRPHLKGRPVMVIGRLGACILAKSPEAKAMGIKTAMPYWEARKLCPNGVYIKGDFRYYTLLSRQLMRFLRTWSPAVQVHSIDEAYLDLAGLEKLYSMSPKQIAERIRIEAQASLGITVSVGVSTNKVLSKMACETSKPNGTRVVLKEGIPAFLAELPIEEIPGIGGKRQKVLRAYGIKTALQLARLSEQRVQRWFGKNGLLLIRELKGEISFPMDLNPAPPKSIMRTSSFEKPTEKLEWVEGLSVYHLERAIEALHRNKLLVSDFSLYLRDKAFRRYHLDHRFELPTNDFYDLISAMKNQFEKVPIGNVWRSAGVTLSRLTPSTGRQLSLFEDPQKLIHSENLNKAKLQLNERFGRTTVRSGATLFINQKLKKKPRLHVIE